MIFIYVCIGFNEILFFIRVLCIEISYPYCPRLLQFLYPFLKRFLNMIEIFKCFYGEVNGNCVWLKLNRFQLETNKPFSLGNGQLRLQYPHCFLFPTWWCLLVTMVEHQGTSSVELLLMQWLYLIPLYLTGKMHFLPVLPPPVVTQSS